MRLFRIAIVLALFTLTAVPVTGAFAATAQRPVDPQFGARRNEQEDVETKTQREMAKKRNEQRHARIKTDTDKLLQLATELKQNVDDSSENTLSLDVIKKAEEIEKLAKSVREKMKSGW